MKNPFFSPSTSFIDKIKFFLVTFILLMSFPYSHLLAGIGDIDENGWTVLTPSSNTRIYYVDAVNGNNTTAQYVEASSVSDIRNPGSVFAYKTIEAAAAVVRDGYPDWILLKRGQSWTDESLGEFKSGLSAGEPLVISYYGTSGDRPLIRNIDNFIDFNGRDKSHLVLHGLHIYNYKQDPDSSDFDLAQSEKVLRLIGRGENILIEDCKFEFNEIVLSGYNGKYNNVNIRRCIVVDTYYNNSANDNNQRPSGLYASMINGLLIEQCVFDHNGWNEDITSAAANMYNHDIYLQYNCSNTIVRDNIITRGAAHGLQLRGCGIAEDNLFVQNAVALNLGYHGHESVYDTIAIAKNNVILEGRDMDPNDVTGSLSTNAVWGIWTSFERFIVENNIIANRIATVPGTATPDDNGAITDYINNIIYNWEDKRDMNNPEWIDPERSVASYHGTLGKTPTFESFITEVRNRPLETWPEEYEAGTINNYFREGFSVATNSAPTASITISEASDVPCTVNFTSTASDPDKDSLSYIWKIEDRWFYEDATSRDLFKGFSTEANTSYTFTYPGTYDINLTVYDGKGGSFTVTKSIQVGGNYPPVSSLEADITEGAAPLLVNFDASGSYDQNGDVLIYYFDFGDGTAIATQDNTVSHVFSTGTYNVSMYVKDAISTSFIKNVTITVSDPTTDFTVFGIKEDALLDANNPDVNYGTVLNSMISETDEHGIFKVSFPGITEEIVSAKLYIASKYGDNGCAVKYIPDDSWKENTVTWNNQPSSNDILAYATYEDGWGVFDVTETVKNETDETLSVLLYETTSGWQEYRYRETSYAIPYLKVETRYTTDNTSPVANISVDVTEGDAPLTVNFDASGSTDADGDVLTYSWDFGDGSTNPSTEKVQYTFESNGSYLVTLLVNDGQGVENGSTSFVTKLIVVGGLTDTYTPLQDNNIKVYPNPVNNGRLFYEIPDITGYKIKVIDLYGKVLINEIPNSENGYLDVSNLPSGVYIFGFENKNKIQTLRFIKMD